MVLNGRGEEYGISLRVINKVKRIAKELNYKPNRLARSLRIGSTKIIGLIVIDIANKFHSKLSRSIEDCAAEKGYRVMVCSSDEMDNKFSEWVDELVDNKVAGLIIAPTTDAKAKILELKRSNYPFVLVDRYFPQIETDYVGIDNFKASYDAVTYLLQQGYRKIGIISFKPDLYHMKQRIEGYKEALKKSGIRVEKRLIRIISYESIDMQVKQNVKSLVREENVRAILFVSNRIGIYGLECLYELKVRIPLDVAVICYDDNEFFPLMNPPITAIAQPIKEMGKATVDLLISRLENGRTDFRQEILEPSFIVRESC